MKNEYGIILIYYAIGTLISFLLIEWIGGTILLYNVPFGSSTPQVLFETGTWIILNFWWVMLLGGIPLLFVPMHVMYIIYND